MNAKTECGAGFVYIVDDDVDFARSTRLLLEASGWHARSFSSVGAFLAECDSLSEGTLLLDLRMPGESGLDLLESGLDRSRFATVVITGHGDIDSAVRSLKAGAVDFLEKPFAAEDLFRALASGAMALAEAGRNSYRDTQLERVRRLTEREREVLRGLLSGLQYKVIAHRLGISARTVEMHREKLLRKLETRSNAEAVRTAVIAGLEPLKN